MGDLEQSSASIQPTTLEVYETGQKFKSDLNVGYKYPSREKKLPVGEIQSNIQILLATVTELNGRIPTGILMRYGIDPLATYYASQHSTRVAMEKALLSEIACKDRKRAKVLGLQEFEMENTIVKIDKEEPEVPLKIINPAPEINLDE